MDEDSPGIREMRAKKKVSVRTKDNVLIEIKRRISDRLNYLDPESPFSKNMERSLTQTATLIRKGYDAAEHDTDNSDPRLAGWEPDGLGICGPKGSKFTIESIDLRGDGFATEHHCSVFYNIELPSGEKRPGVAHFSKRGTPYVYDVGALRAYLENAIGEDIFAYCDRLDRVYEEAIDRHGSLKNMSGDERSALAEKMDATERELSPNIPETYLKELIRPLHYHLDCMRDIEEILEPLGKERGLLLQAIENRINFIFGLALELRQKELEALHLSDALRGKAVVTGGDRGGRAQAARSSAHAATWKRNFGKWLQPLLSKQSSDRGISLDKLIDLAEDNWPEKGFEGLPGLRQSACPSRQTLLNAIKALEKEGIITRRRPPKGRARG